MKTQNISLVLALVVAVTLAGCSKQEPATPSAEDATKALHSTTAEAQKTAEAAKTAGEKIVTDAAKAAPDIAQPAITATASSSAQDMIDKARKLVAAGQYQEAMSTLQQLASQKLSGNQQSLVDGLKAQIQKALGGVSTTPSGAAGAAGSLLKK